MTDNEIIKALECHSRPSNSCGSNCPYLMCEEVMCTKKLSKDALDLINRQKAEIERLKGWENLLKAEKHSLIKAEAVKEFAEKVSKLICDNTYPDFDKDGKAVNIWNAKDGYKQIDNLLKEMVGDN